MANDDESDWWEGELAKQRAVGAAPGTDGGVPTPVEEQMSPADVARSLIYARGGINKSMPEELWWQQTVSLIRWQGPTNKARSWHVTLGAIQRADGVAVNQYISTSEPPLGRRLLGSSTLPTRAYLPPSGAPWWVRVRWGTGGAAPFELVAHWPVHGGGFDIVGSFVQVDAFFQFDSQFGELGLNLDPTPVFAASMAPAAPGTNAMSMDLGFTMTETLPAGEGVTVVHAVPPFARWAKFWVQADFAVVATPSLLIIDWLDGNGAIVCQSMPPPQFIPTGGAPISIPLDRWEPVPPNACTVRVSTVFDFTNDALLSTSWRISP